MNGSTIEIIRQTVCALAIYPLVRWFWRDEINMIKNKINEKLNKDTTKEAA
jgi:hypothetical protein